MTTCAIPIPRAFVEAHAIGLSHDFAHRHASVLAAADGSLTVLSHLFYNYYRYDSDDNRDVTGWFVTRFAGDGQLLWSADLSEMHHELDDQSERAFGLLDCYEPRAFFLDDGNLAITTQGNRLIAYDAELEREVARWCARDVMDEAAMKAENYVYDVDRDSTGQAVCIVNEPGLGIAGWRPSLLCLPQGPLTAERRPTLTAIATFSSDATNRASLESRPGYGYVALPCGELVAGLQRPSPGLIEQTDVSLSRPVVRQAFRLDADRLMVPVFHRGLRGGSKGLPFALMLVSRTGEVLRRLEGIDANAESPYVDHRHSLAVIHAARAIVYSNKFCLWVWSLDGELVHKESLDGKDNKALRPFAPVASTHDGRLVLCHPKHHCLVVTAPISSSSDVAPAIVEALAAHRKEKSALKKQLYFEKNRWVSEGPVRRPQRTPAPGRP